MFPIRTKRSCLRVAGAALFALLVLLGAAGCRQGSGNVLGGGDPDWTAVNQAATPAVVRVRVTTCDGVGYGSGFFVDATTIVSNEHVVAEATRVEIDAPTHLGTSAGAEIAPDGTDLSVIQAPAPSDRTLPLAAADPVPGDRVEVIGYPGGGQVTVTPGRVIEIADGAHLDVAGPVIYSDARVRPGNSGGPMVNGRGEVVGVVMALEYREGQGMAVPVSVLRGMLTAPRRAVATTC